jgi:hypothetical protein
MESLMALTKSEVLASLERVASPDGLVLPTGALSDIVVPDGKSIFLRHRGCCRGECLNEALVDLAVRKNYSDSAQEVIGGTADQFLQPVSKDFAKFGRLAKELDMKVE